MNKETILKAVEHCLDKTTSCIGCPLVNRGDVCGVYLTEYISSKENEPAPAGAETSPNKNILHLDDTTLLEICQEAMLKVCDRIIEVDGDAYILGYIHSVLDAVNKLKGEEK